MRLSRRAIIEVLLCRSLSVVALRIELSAPWLSAEDGQPALDYRRVLSSSYGSRTHFSVLKGRILKPIDERANYLRVQRAGRRSNPHLMVFSQSLRRLSYRPDL